MERKEKDAISKHYAAPGLYTQKDVMKRLKLGRNYNKFYSLFYQYVINKKHHED